MVFDFKTLEDAYKLVRRGKRDAPNHVRYWYYLEDHLHYISTKLTDQTYEPTKLRTKVIQYPKRRIARVPVINDKIVQHAICDLAIYPAMEHRMVKEASAGMKGRGQEYACDLLKEQLREYYRKHGTNHFYVLKCDIHSYFASIDHERMKALLDCYVDDPDALYWAKRYIDLPEVPEGIPLGLQESHINSNIYLIEMDYMLKYRLRLRYYGRYKDDFYIVHESKECLEGIRDMLEQYLQSIHLEFNPKTAILEDKFDFLGFEFRLTETGKAIARLARPKLRMHRKRLKKLLRQLNAGEIEPQELANYYQGWRTHASYGDCKSLVHATDKRLENRLKEMGYIFYLKKAKHKSKKLNERVMIEPCQEPFKN